MYYPAGGVGKGNIRPNQHLQQQPQHHLQHHHHPQQQQPSQHQVQHHYTTQQPQQQHHLIHQQQQQDQQHQQTQQILHQLSNPQSSQQFYNSLQINHQQHNTHQQHQSLQQQNGLQSQVVAPQLQSQQTTQQATVSASTSGSSSIALGVPNRQQIMQPQHSQTSLQASAAQHYGPVHHHQSTAIMPTAFMTTAYMQQYQQTGTVAVAAPPPSAPYCASISQQSPAPQHQLVAAAAPAHTSQQVHTHANHLAPQALHQPQQHQQTQLHHHQQPPQQQAHFFSTHYSHAHQQTHMRGVPQTPAVASQRFIIPSNATLFALPRSASHLIAAQHSASTIGAAVSVPSLLQQTSQSRGGGGSGIAGAHHFSAPSFCPSMAMASPAAAAIMGPTPPPSMMSSTGVAASTSSLSMQGYVTTVPSVETIAKPRKYAIPIIDPKTLEEKLIPPALVPKTDTSTIPTTFTPELSAVIPDFTPSTLDIASDVLNCANPILNDDIKSISSDLENHQQANDDDCSSCGEEQIYHHEPLTTLSIELSSMPTPKIKIDQQMQTDAVKEKSESLEFVSDYSPSFQQHLDIDESDASQIEEEPITVVVEAEEELENKNICCELPYTDGHGNDNYLNCSQNLLLLSSRIL